MIFSLAIQPIILSLDSQLNIWYLADHPKVVLSDLSIYPGKLVLN
jgi:hypothetical protein